MYFTRAVLTVFFLKLILINQSHSQQATIGENGDSIPFASFISFSGILTSPEIGDMGAGNIRSFAINNSGRAIIGGADNNKQLFAALISPAGISTPIATGAVGSGSIFSVAINDINIAIIGGRDNDNTTPFAAFISPKGISTPIVTGAVGNGSIFDVGINSSSIAIIGGQDNGDTTPFAAFISPTGISTPIVTGAVGNGFISSVDINDTGTAIIGGLDNGSTTPFAALISPSGISTLIETSAIRAGTIRTGAVRQEEIDEVAISNTGAAIIGGSDGGDFSFAALISPLGVVTPLSLNLVGSSMVNSVALLDAAIPRSFSTGNFANALFVLSSQVLSEHTSFQKTPVATEIGLTNNETVLIENYEMGLLADASDFTYLKGTPIKKKYDIWAAPFGYYAHQKKSEGFAAVTDWTAGLLIGLDYYSIEDVAIGGGVAYAYDYGDLAEGNGHTKTNQGFLTLYGSWLRNNFFINVAVWGGGYRSKNVRHSIDHITSKSNVGGWLFLPHLEISFPFYAKEEWFLIDPFAMFDWANNWQGRVREKGASGLNLTINHEYTSILRSEVGVRFFEYLRYTWGTFVLEEKGSWVNLHPFHTGPVQTSFIGADSSFAIELFRNNTQNLGAILFSTKFFPYSLKYPYGSINYQGEFGSSSQSHLVSLEIGKFF